MGERQKAAGVSPAALGGFGLGKLLEDILEQGLDIVQNPLLGFLGCPACHKVVELVVVPILEVLGFQNSFDFFCDLVGHNFLSIC